MTEEQHDQYHKMRLFNDAVKEGIDELPLIACSHYRYIESQTTKNKASGIFLSPGSYATEYNNPHRTEFGGSTKEYGTHMLAPLFFNDNYTQEDLVDCKNLLSHRRLKRLAFTNDCGIYTLSYDKDDTTEGTFSSDMKLIKSNFYIVKIGDKDTNSIAIRVLDYPVMKVIFYQSNHKSGFVVSNSFNTALSDITLRVHDLAYVPDEYTVTKVEV
jgi:hypothetical protein